MFAATVSDAAYPVHRWVCESQHRANEKDIASSCILDSLSTIRVSVVVREGHSNADSGGMSVNTMKSKKLVCITVYVHVRGSY